MKRAGIEGLTFGVVVIGRNEGDRLRKCLNSITGFTSAVVYVDSDSSDNSVSFANSLAVDVVELDMSVPFTAARARNEGFDRLMQLYPSIKYVQFVDGDCEVINGWFDRAISAFQHADRSEQLGVVFGVCKERFPGASLYNSLADRGWEIPAGYTETSGGNAFIAVDAFNEVGGFDVSLIAGEEPDLCLRMRRVGWRILSVSVAMVWHDSDIHNLYQWYKRAVRTGHAFAEISWKNRMFPERYWVRHNIRILCWGLLLPLMVCVLSFINIAFLSLLLIYPIQVARIARREGWVYAFFCVLVKFPHAIGQAKFAINALLGKRSGLIEYK